jgi:hypothetical protein
MLTILIPVYEKESIVEKFIEGNREILSKFPLIVVNREGGSRLRQFPNVTYLYDDYRELPFWDARRLGLSFVKTRYVLNLDVDTILPLQYIEDAIYFLEHMEDLDVVAINYKKPHNQDHPSFGTSIWRTEVMSKLYDYKPENYPNCICECKYMWNKMIENNIVGLTLLKYEAIHLRG